MAYAPSSVINTGLSGVVLAWLRYAAPHLVMVQDPIDGFLFTCKACCKTETLSNFDLLVDNITEVAARHQHRSEEEDDFGHAGQWKNYLAQQRPAV